MGRPILLLAGAGALAACAGVGKTCFSDTGFPASAVERWKLGSLPSSAGQRWRLSLKKGSDTCGVAVASLETAIVIQGASLPDPEVATLSNIDVTVEIAVPGTDGRSFHGHQYTPEALRKDGQSLKPSYVYGASNFPDDSSAPVHFACTDSAYRRRELESVQLTDMTARTASARVSFLKGVFAVAGGKPPLESCWVEYVGTGRIDSK